jgi:hypothetical protein
VENPLDVLSPENAEFPTNLDDPAELYRYGIRVMTVLAGASPDLHIRRDAAAFLCREFESFKPGSKDFMSERAQVVAELLQAITKLVPAPAASAETESDEPEPEMVDEQIEMEVEIEGNAPDVSVKSDNPARNGSPTSIIETAFVVAEHSEFTVFVLLITLRARMARSTPRDVPPQTQSTERTNDRDV